MTARLSRRALLTLGAGCALGACLPDGRFKKRHATVPEQLADGWEIGRPDDVDLDERTLAAIHEELLREDRQRGALGLLVVRDDRLVWETYLHDVLDRDRPHHIQSMTKSITSLAFALAQDRGHLAELSLTLRDLVPQELTGAARNKGDIALRDLLTMRSGIAFYNDTFAVEMWVDRPPHPLRYMLEKRLYAAPGERFVYRDVDTQILGYLLQSAVGRNEESWTRELLFEPLGIRDYVWEHGRDGTSLAAHGLHLRPRDLAKIGQLMLNEGTFAGERIVSAERLRAFTRTEVPTGDAGTGHERLGYGYYWWTVADTDHYLAWGHGGQHILVAPAQRLVIVKIALPDTDNLAGSSPEEFLDLVAPLLKS